MFNSTVYDVVLQADGKPLVAGAFTTYINGASVPRRLVRLDANGSLDATFNPGGTGFNNTVYNLALQADGKVLVSGFFSQYNGASVPFGLVRLNTDGSLDTSFNPGGAGFSTGVNDIALQDDGKVLVAGGFNTYNGTVVPRGLVRLNVDGSLDTSFNPGGAGFSSGGNDVAVQDDGKVVVVGSFNTYNGASVPRGLVRLNADGSLDTSFNPGGAGFNTSVSLIALQTDGRMLAGGNFTTYNGAGVPLGLVRINADGSRDASFNSGGSGFDPGPMGHQRFAT